MSTLFISMRVPTWWRPLSTSCLCSFGHKNPNKGGMRQWWRAIIHPSIHFLYPLNPIQGHEGGLEPILAAFGQEVGYNMEKVDSQGNNLFTFSCSFFMVIAFFLLVSHSWVLTFLPCSHSLKWLQVHGQSYEKQHYGTSLDLLDCPCVGSWALPDKKQQPGDTRTLPFQNLQQVPVEMWTITS